MTTRSRTRRVIAVCAGVLVVGGLTWGILDLRQIPTRQVHGACAGRLYQVNSALVEYRNRHSRYPASLETLLEEGLVVHTFLQCPFRNELATDRIDYLYTPPPDGGGDSWIVVCDPEPHPHGKRNVLRASGVVETLIEAQFADEQSMWAAAVGAGGHEGGGGVAVDDEAQGSAPNAQSVLRGLADHLATLQSFTVEMGMSMSAEGPGIKQKYDTRHQLSVRKPDKLALISMGGVVGFTVICDGRNQYIHNPMTGEGETTSLPGDGGLDNPSLSWVAPAMPHEAVAISYIEALVSSDPFPRLFPESWSVSYDGTEIVEGVECHKLKITLGEKGGWTLFLDTSEAPLPRKIEPDTSDVSAEMPEMKMRLSIVFRDWKLNPEIPDDQFRIPSEDKAN